MNRTNQRNLPTRSLKIGTSASTLELTMEYWIKPFAAETGISVEYVTDLDVAEVKAQVASGNVLLDVVDGLASLGGADLWEPIDFEVVDPERFLVKPLSYAVPGGVYAGGIAWDPSRTKHPPRDFSQFWDVENFPGSRGLRTRCTEVLEAALIADGVAPSKLYPLDVDRAFKALDRIKPHVRKWFDLTAEGTSLIQRNEVDYIYTYANRVKAAKDSGVSIDFSFDQNVHVVEWFSVVKGSPYKEDAMQLLEFITRPAQQAIAANKMDAVPTTKGAEELVDPAVRRWLPDLSNPKNVFMDSDYWRAHFTEINKRYKEWILA